MSRTRARFTHRCECAAAWACVALAAGWWWHDAPVGHHHHVLAAELLLKLANQPLLDLVEVLQQAVGNLDTARTNSRQDKAQGASGAAGCQQQGGTLELLKV
jgi:hypothetical protein